MITTPKSSMQKAYRKYFKNHFALALVVFVILAACSHLHGMWWKQLQFIVFMPVYYVARSVLPVTAFWQSGGTTHIVGEVVINTLGFLWVWMIVYLVSLTLRFLKKTRPSSVEV
jgi:hypothetical protein